MGRVLLAAGPDGRLVAVKLVHGYLLDDEFRARFRREVAASSRVSGAFTAPVVDADPGADNPWLASVFVPGPALDAAVAQFGPLPAQTVRTLAAGLATALLEVHRVGLIHRDLKPSNVLLSADGPRVIDFGIARAADGGKDVTHTGSVVGSPAYMSPEQADGLPLTPASDIFSLGSVLAMAATGDSPFAANSIPQALYNVVFAEPDLSRLPQGIHELVRACLQRDARHRPTPAQVLDFVTPIEPAAQPWPAPIHAAIDAQQRALTVLLDPERTTATTAFAVPPVPPPVRSVRRINRYRPIAAVLGALVVGIGAVAFAVRGSDPPVSQSAPTTTATEVLSNSRDKLTATLLASADPCVLLREEIASAAGGRAGAPESSTPTTCVAHGADGNQITVDTQTDMSATFRGTADRIDDIAVLKSGDDSQKTCAAGVRAAAPNHTTGVSVRVTSTTNTGMCTQATEYLTPVIKRLLVDPPLK